MIIFEYLVYRTTQKISYGAEDLKWLRDRNILSESETSLTSQNLTFSPVKINAGHLAEARALNRLTEELLRSIQVLNTSASRAYPHTYVNTLGSAAQGVLPRSIAGCRLLGAAGNKDTANCHASTLDHASVSRFSWLVTTDRPDRESVVPVVADTQMLKKLRTFSTPELVEYLTESTILDPYRSLIASTRTVIQPGTSRAAFSADFHPLAAVRARSGELECIHVGPSRGEEIYTLSSSPAFSAPHGIAGKTPPTEVTHIWGSSVDDSALWALNDLSEAIHPWLCNVGSAMASSFKIIAEASGAQLKTSYCVDKLDEDCYSLKVKIEDLTQLPTT